ncbi:hypothetical protein [Vibrio splendidus]|uniref:hypothetical protein n=1 Tax=Vibrio splendidus TaxID=29497 RepID=UPI000CF39FE1|nr:hypothetical protein [Vibrio splendidus]PQJ56532.1 hypothetical protein BTO12_02970 [Vibrio splendidus]
MLSLLDNMFLISQVTLIPALFLLCFLILRKGFNGYQVFLTLPIVIFFIILNFFPFFARVNIVEILNENVLIIDDGGRFNKDDLIRELKGLHFIASENSHPVGDRITIKIITDKKRKKIFLLKDSFKPGRYWLYDEDYRYSTKNNIGFINLKE